MSQRRTGDQVVALREEVEAPFRKPRLFLAVAAGGSGAIGAAVTLTQLLSQGPQPPLFVNLAVDVAAALASVAFIQADLTAQERRRARLEAGRQVAALRVRLQWPGDSGVVSLADLRGGRGRDSRVVIVIGKAVLLRRALDGARALGERLRAAELLVVPYAVDDNDLGTTSGDAHVALPVGDADWSDFVRGSELARAEGIDLNGSYLCVIVKKNGRIGQRAFLADGEEPWLGLIGDVDRRRAAGMDVTNI